MKYYSASIGRTLFLVTLLVVMLLAGISLNVFISFSGLMWLSAIIPVSMLLIAPLFLIRGYSISADGLIIHRLFWTNRIDSNRIESVEHIPDAMKNSLRTFGNGGFFSYTGYYRNDLLGEFRAFVMNSRDVVVVKCKDANFVISPSNPELFCRDFTFLLMRPTSR